MSEHASHHEKIYSRPRVSALLDRATAGTLVVVCAPAGYGKTTAVADYLASGLREYTIVWLGMTEADNHAVHFWRRLREELVRAGADGAILEKISDPAAAEPQETLALFAEAVESLKRRLRAEKRWHAASRIAVVCDDFHLVRSASILRFVADAASRSVRKLKFFAVSRTFPVFPARVRRMTAIGAEALSFDRNEISGWLELFHPAVRQFEVRKYDGGRISDMQMLAALSGNEASAQSATDEEALARVFERYDPPVKTFLLRVSVLEEFPIPLCAAAAGCTEKRAVSLMRRVAATGTLVAHGAIHHILRDFLCEKLRAKSEPEWAAALARVAEWYRAHGDLYAAANCYVRSGDFRALAHLLEELVRDDRTTGMQLNEFARDEFHLRRKLFEHIPPETVREEAPLLELFYIFMLILLRDMDALARRMAEVRAHYGPMPESPVRNRILGELELMGTTLVYNDFQSKAAAFDRAQALLGGPSLLARTPLPVIFGSPSALPLYYNEFRPLEEIVSGYALHWKKHDAMLGGAFSGLEELLRGEVAYERGEFAPVKRYAELALNNTRQYAVAMAAHFLLVRDAFAKGRLDGVLTGLTEILRIALDEKRQLNYSTVDFSFGLAGALLGEPEIVPRWLREGDLEKSRGMGVGVGVRLETFPYTLLLSISNRFAELKRALPEIRAGYERARTRLGLLYCTIYDAMLYEAEGARTAAEDALRAAWQMAEPDGLVMPFVERSVRLYPLVRRLAQVAKRTGGGGGESEVFTQWLLRMERMMKRHNRTLLALRRTYFVRRNMLRNLLRIGDTGEAEGDRDFLPRTLLAALSPREAEVYALREAGADVDAISARLGLRYGNAKNILLHVEEKTGLLRDLTLK